MVTKKDAACFSVCEFDSCYMSGVCQGHRTASQEKIDMVKSLMDNAVKAMYEEEDKRMEEYYRSGVETIPAGDDQIPQQMKQFKSDARSSVIKPRYDLIPLRADELNAGRFGYGAIRHGERNYLNGKDDAEFITDRINHLLEHAKNFARYRKTSDLAAVLCNASILAEVEADTVRDGADGKQEVA